MYKRALTAVGAGVAAMAAPDSTAAIQARNELLACVGALYGALRDSYDPADTLDTLRWLDAFCRYPYSLDDPAPVPGARPNRAAARCPLPGAALLQQLSVRRRCHRTSSSQTIAPLPPPPLPPERHAGVTPALQKAALAAIIELAPLTHAEVWPELVRMLTAQLCPMRALVQQQRFLQRAEAEAAEAAAAAAAAPARPSVPSSPSIEPEASADEGTPAMPILRMPHGMPRQSEADSELAMSGTSFVQPPAEDASCRYLTAQWMTRVITALVRLYREHAPWQARARALAQSTWQRAASRQHPPRLPRHR